MEREHFETITSHLLENVFWVSYCCCRLRLPFFSFHFFLCLRAKANSFGCPFWSFLEFSTLSYANASMSSCVALVVFLFWPAKKNLPSFFPVLFAFLLPPLPPVPASASELAHPSLTSNCFVSAFIRLPQISFLHRSLLVCGEPRDPCRVLCSLSPDLTDPVVLRYLLFTVVSHDPLSIRFASPSPSLHSFHTTPKNNIRVFFIFLYTSE